MSCLKSSGNPDGAFNIHIALPLPYVVSLHCNFPWAAVLHAYRSFRSQRWDVTVVL